MTAAEPPAYRLAGIITLSRSDVKDGETLHSTPDIQSCGITRHTLGKTDDHMGMNQAPVPPPPDLLFWHDPSWPDTVFSADCHRWERRICLDHLAQLTVEALNSIGGVDQPQYLLWTLEISAEIGPARPLGLKDFGYFLSQRSPKVSKQPARPRRYKPPSDLCRTYTCWNFAVGG